MSDTAAPPATKRRGSRLNLIFGIATLAALVLGALLGWIAKTTDASWRATTLERIDACSAGAEGYAFQVELTYRALSRGLRVIEAPIVFRERGAGRSKMTPRIALEAVWRVPAVRSSSRRELPTPRG